MGPPMVPVLVYLGLSYAAFCAFVAALQGVVMERLGAALPSPSHGKPAGIVADLLLIHLHFVCRVVVDSYLFCI